MKSERTPPKAIRIIHGVEDGLIVAVLSVMIVLSFAEIIIRNVGGGSFAWSSPFLRYLIIIGEESGGVTGAPEDWLTLLNKKSMVLSRFSRGRTGLDRHAATVFWRRKLG